jgi:hypothetical protein
MATCYKGRMAILPLVLLAALTPTDWSVDPAGSGDFTTLQAALAAPQVVDGDRLWIAPGEYGQVLVTKAVDLLALPGQRFSADMLQIQNVNGLTVQGLTTRFLSLSDCPGPVDLLDVQVGRDASLPVDPGAPMVYGEMQVWRCDQVLIAGSLLRGTRQCYPEASSPDTALLAVDSRIAISGTTILGGDDLGATGEGWYCSAHYPSPAAISAHRCDLTFSAAILRGAASSWAGSGVALSITDGSLDARGIGSELWTAGHPGSLVITGNSVGSLSAIQLSPPGLPSWLTTPDQPLPLLKAPALAASGGSYTVEFFAPLGMPAAVAVSAVPALDLTNLAGLGALWFDLSAPFALYLEIGLGSSQPARETFQISSSPALLGLPIRLQAYVPPCFGTGCPWGGAGSLTPPLGVLIQ